MIPPSESEEDELFFSRVIQALFHAFHRTTVARDFTSLDDRKKYFEKFEIFLYIPASVNNLNGKDIQSIVFFDTLAYEAVRAIEEHYEQMKPSIAAPPAGIGIHTETEWKFGDEVLEATNMLGDKETITDIPVLFSFWVRFIQPIPQTARRCKTKKITLPPIVRAEDEYKEWKIDQEGIISEEFSFPGSESKEIVRKYHLRPPEPPKFYPQDDSD